MSSCFPALHPVILPDAEYRFSSANFYETGEDEFKILAHLIDKL
jgi:hypothetical protein